jgi:hypothetical protein
MRHPNAVVATRMIEQVLSQYESFFDHDWAKQISGITPPELEDALDSLRLAWKEAANTHAQPWLMMMQIESLAHSLLVKKQPEITKLIQSVNGWLRQNVMHTFNREKKKELEPLVRRFDQGLRIAEDSVDRRYPIEHHWRLLLSNSEMQMSIGGSQGLAYCGLVFAYEWFLVSCYRTLGGHENYRPNQDKFWNDWEMKFGQSGRTTYWDPQPVAIARETRNCIAHTGGKVKQTLLAMNPSYFISPQGVLSIQPSDNRDLFNVLKEKVNSLVAEVDRVLRMRQADHPDFTKC